MRNASENKDNCAGRYVLQPTGYRALIPAPLPPSPPPTMRWAASKARC